MRVDPSQLLLTCEHGGCSIPGRYRALFASRSRLLQSHRGWDAGALECARHFERAFHAPLCASTVSRLLVDLNRSRSNPDVFSSITRGLPPSERERILAAYYTPYWTTVEQRVRAIARAGTAIHVSVHSFTPVLRGERRDIDVAWLFDPARAREAVFCRAWRAAFARRRPGLRLAFNKPYRGIDDGLTTHLRSRLPVPRYLGIELEINQRFARRSGPGWRRLQADLAASLARALGLD